MRLPFSSPPRILRWLLIAYACVALPTNLVLWTGLVPQLTKSSTNGEESFRIRYPFALSVWPGQAWIFGLELHGRDPNVDWYVRLARTSLRVRMGALLEKRLEIPLVSVNRARVEIVHHGLPPERFEEDPFAKGPEGWPFSIDIRAVSIASLTEAKLDDTVIAPNPGERSPIDGGLWLVGGRELTIRRASWTIGPSTVRIGDSAALENATGLIRVDVDHAPTWQVGGNDIFRYFDIDLDLKAELRDARALKGLLAGYRAVELDRSRGSLSVAVRVRDGILQDESRIEAAFDPISFGFQRSRLSGKGSFDWFVQGGKLGIDLLLTGLEWRSFQPSPVLTGGQLRLTGGSSILDLTSPFRDLNLTFQLSEARILNIQSLIAALTDNSNPKRAPRLRSSGGDRLLAEGSLSALDRRYIGKIRYESPSLKWARPGEPTQIEAATTLEAVIGSTNYDTGLFSLRGVDLRARRLRVVHEGETTYDRDTWNVRATFDRSEVVFEPQFSAKGRFGMALEDLKVPVRFLLSDKKLLGFVVGLFPLRNFRSNADFDFSSEGLKVDGFRANSDSGFIRGEVHSPRDSDARGAFLLELTPITGCLVLKDGKVDFTGSDPRKRCARAWSARQDDAR